MKKIICVLFCLLLFSCNREYRDIRYISEKQTCVLIGDVVISSDSNLNVFSDLAITNNYTIFLDFFGDTIFKAYRNADLLLPAISAVKGNGPNDFISPYFNKTNYNNSNDSILYLIDLNSWSIKSVNLYHNKNTPVFVKSEPLYQSFPPISECNITSKTIIGTDVDVSNNRLFFIFNKENKSIQSVPYYPIIDKKYEQEYLSYLYESKLIVNEGENSICVAMKNFNMILFYDLNGQRLQSIGIGNAIRYPEKDDGYLDFPKFPKYFTHINATKQYVYCLYQGGDEANSLTKIFILDWHGKHISTIQTERNLFKIAISPDDKYIFGLSITQDGGTDVVKYQFLR